MRDYYNGCPVCGIRHHKGTLVGLTRMNAKCARRYQRMSQQKRMDVFYRWFSGKVQQPERSKR